MLDATTHARLAAILPPEALLTSSEATRPYECDGLSVYRAQPAAVALPENEEQVVAILRACHAAGIPVVPRPAGEARPGGAERERDPVPAREREERLDLLDRAHARDHLRGLSCQVNLAWLITNAPTDLRFTKKADRNSYENRRQKEEGKKEIKTLVVGIITHGKKKKFAKRDEYRLNLTSFANPTLFKREYIKAFCLPSSAF